MHKNKAIVLFGPTAVGKTELTEILAKDSEIINADSIQVYKYLNIGSAKPSDELQKKIKHHLIDILDPQIQFTSGDFANLAIEKIKDINSRGMVPIISGGTAYYLRELIYGKSNTPESDPKIRLKVKALLDEKGKDYIFDLLKEVDEKSTSKIKKNDIYRVTRALEVYYQTGMPLSSFERNNQIRNDIEFLLICLIRNKEELNKRIEKRVDIMFDQGLYEEIKFLFSLGASSSWPSMQAIGYKEFIEYKEDGEKNLSQIKNEIIQASKKYAKRQMTFFKTFDSVNYFHPENDKEKIIKLCQTFTKAE